MNIDNIEQQHKETRESMEASHAETKFWLEQTVQAREEYKKENEKLRESVSLIGAENKSLKDRITLLDES
jgi:hypothetical protein